MNFYDFINEKPDQSFPDTGDVFTLKSFDKVSNKTSKLYNVLRLPESYELSTIDF
jgi:hypothetical protein